MKKFRRHPMRLPQMPQECNFTNNLLRDTVSTALAKSMPTTAVWSPLQGQRLESSHLKTQVSLMSRKDGLRISVGRDKLICR